MAMQTLKFHVMTENVDVEMYIDMEKMFIV